MVRVVEVTDEDAPLALLVDNNAMSLYRMNEILRQKDYKIIECKDGDKAVDLFITEVPELDDLDELYPEIENDEEEIEIELEELPPPPPPSALPALAPPPKRRKKGRGLLFLSIALFIGAAVAIGYGLNELGYI